MRKRKKILFIVRDVNHWGIKHLAERLNTTHELIIYLYNASEANIVWLDNRDIKYKRIKVSKRMSKLNLILSFFTKHPRTRVYKVHLKRNILRNYSLKRYFYYLMMRFFPKIISVNSVAKILGKIESSYEEEIQRENIDRVLYISRFLPSYDLVTRLYSLGYDVNAWIYSWDNPFKDSFLPSLFSKYFVWNEQMKDDLYKIHNIEKEKQVIVGTVIFDYLKLGISDSKELKNSELNKIISDHSGVYILYMFGTGYSPAIFQEMKLLRLLSDILLRIDPAKLLIARPYPDSKYPPSVYDELDSLPNVYVQKGLKQFNEQTDEMNIEKIRLMQNALVNINAMTTMGLESSFFNNEIIQLAYFPVNLIGETSKKLRSLDADVLMKNEHLQKYLMLTEYANVVCSTIELETQLTNIIQREGNPSLVYNQYLQEFANPIKDKKAVDLIVENLV